MMKQNGFTVIELLAGLTILGIVITIVFAVFNTGIRQGEETKKGVFLQQEANLVATTLRKAHLEGDAQYYSLMISDNEITLNGHSISNQFHYKAKINGIESTSTHTIDTSSTVQIEITFSNDQSSYTLRTTLSKGVK